MLREKLREQRSGHLPEIDARSCGWSTKGGWIYFLREELIGPIKIGRAWNPITRLVAAQVGNPRLIHLVGAIFVAERSTLTKDPLENSKRLERELHARFRAARIRGEWFAPVDELVAFIHELPRKEAP